jgi:hypothetical protein
VNLPCAAHVFLRIDRFQQYAGFVMISFMVAVVLAPMVLYFYRWRVLRLMAGPADAGDAVMEAPGLSRADEPDSGTDFPGIEALKLASRERATRLAWSLRIVALIFTLVTVALSLALKWQAVSSGQTPPGVSVLDPRTMLFRVLVMLGLAWPMVILGTAKPRFGRWFILITLPCLVTLMLGPLQPGMPTGEQLTGYVVLLGVIVGMCLGLIPRHMRNVVPMLTLCLSLAAIVWAEANNLADIYKTCVGLTINTREEALRLLWLPIGLIALMLATGIYGIYGLLRAITSAYRNKRFSDAQLQVLFWYIVLAVPAICYSACNFDPLSRGIGVQN